MKTYLLTIPEKIKGISNTLDITAALCNKSWIVFNDEGVKLLFIFESDGTLIVSKNGVVSKQKWSYIKANSSVLIEDSQQAFLLHPAFVDNFVFALQQDGTKHHLLMIDEKQMDKFSVLSIESINQYFKNIEESQNSKDGRLVTKTNPIIPKEERERREKELNKQIWSELKSETEHYGRTEDMLYVISSIVSVSICVYLWFVINPMIFDFLPDAWKKDTAGVTIGLLVGIFCLLIKIFEKIFKYVVLRKMWDEILRKYYALRQVYLNDKN